MSRAMQHELLACPDRWQPTSPDERGRWETFVPDLGFLYDEVVPVIYSEEIAEVLREDWDDENAR